ncbi:MAG TPA: flagellar M-ring protein FliF C-terminal domain-containing protein [Phycisphaerae bacterium]|nr:flagellar M-ring protein FliF C-terminal domain-containing protein [Phycisphaerae bacterium]
MDYLKRIVDQISQQLGVLGRSQRLAIGLCAVIVAGSLLWLVNFSTSPERVPLLDQNMSLAEIDTILTELENEHIEAKQTGNKVYVKLADRDRALLALNRANALPKDTSIGFAEYMADDDPFRPADENQWRRQVALATELGRVLSSGDEIASARVLFQGKTKRGMGNVDALKPTASVYLKLKAGKAFNAGLVEGVCRFVSGAVPGLMPHSVTVVDAATMRPYTLPDPEDALGADLLDQRKQNERHLTEKLVTALRSIPGVLVSVSVELDATRRKTTTQDYGKQGIKSEDTSETSNNSGNGSGETGVAANVGVALSGGSTQTTNHTEEAHNEYFPAQMTKHEDIEHAPFTLKHAMASIAIPRSFLVGVHRARFGEDVDVAKLDDNEDFRTLRESEVARVRSAAMNILMTQDPKDVDVTVFYDFAPDSQELNTFPGGGMVAAAADDSGTMGYVKRYGMQGGVLGLALISFLMMARMVRKSSEVVAAILPPQARQKPAAEPEEMLSVTGGPVGKAAATEGLLVGQEVDEETLRFTQLGSQVSQMVDTDPETAAELIRRWAEADE